MRWQHRPILTPAAAVALIALPLASCGTVEVPPIPAPWDPTESQLAVPVSPTEAGTPAWNRIGSSIRGKPLEAVTLGSGPRRIYVIGGIHGDDPEGPAVADLLPRALLEDFVGEAGETTTLRIVRDMNPDGSATRSRGNTRGTDLNRNWPSRDFVANGPDIHGRRHGARAASELETSTVAADLRAFKPDLVILFDTAAAGRGPNVNFLAMPKQRALDFTSAARGVDPRWRLSPDQLHVRSGSVESFVGRDMKKPILTLEFQRGRDAQTNLRAFRAGLMEFTKPVPAAAAPAGSVPKAAAPKAAKAGAASASAADGR